MTQALQSAVVLIAITPITHDKERVPVGSAFEVSDKHAQPLIACGAARKATADEEQAFRDQAAGSGNANDGADSNGDGAAGNDSNPDAAGAAKPAGKKK